MNTNQMWGMPDTVNFSITLWNIEVKTDVVFPHTVLRYTTRFIYDVALHYPDS